MCKKMTSYVWKYEESTHCHKTSWLRALRTYAQHQTVRMSRMHDMLKDKYEEVNLQACSCPRVHMIDFVGCQGSRNAVDIP